jgi:uncharacterized membrane protein YtjA (UPF0391 family)
MLPPGTRFSKAELSRDNTPNGVPRFGNKPPRSKLDQRFSVVIAGPPGAGGAAMTILKWALIFFLVSIAAGVFGFTGVSAATADIARFLFYVFVVIFLVLLILGLTISRV